MSGIDSRLKQKRVFISWSPYDTRSDSLAHYLGARCYHIHYFKLTKFRYIYAPFKYILASVKTLIYLHRDRPDIILVQNPPIFAVLIVWLYSLFSKAAFITDSHTGAFDRWRWKLFLWLYRFLAQRALVNIIHNKPLTRKIAQWGIPAITLGDIPFCLDTDTKYPFSKSFNVLVINTFSDDEPLDEVLEAAKHLPAVNFYITGDLGLAPVKLIPRVSENVVFTGFLPFNEYVASVKDCNVVIVLTTKDFTMQNGAYEAMELERPIITSDWPVLRETFSRGTIHVDNRAESIVNAIEEIQRNYSYYLDEIKQLRLERRAVWEQGFSELIAHMESEQTKKIK